MRRGERKQTSTDEERTKRAGKHEERDGKERGRRRGRSYETGRRVGVKATTWRDGFSHARTRRRRGMGEHDVRTTNKRTGEQRAQIIHPRPAVHAPSYSPSASPGTQYSVLGMRQYTPLAAPIPRYPENPRLRDSKTTVLRVRAEEMRTRGDGREHKHEHKRRRAHAEI